MTEAMLSCTSGMLLCLDREQRLTFILGAIFEVSDTVAAEVLEITPDNFRQRLARARRDLRNFMNDKCGLVNQANPCRCAKKTRGFIQAGYVDPKNLLFVRERIGEVREAAPNVHEGFLAEEWRSRQRPLRRIHRQERGRCQGQLQGGDRRGSYFKQGTEPSARMACRLLRGKHRRPGRIQHRDCL